jgi:hypothetical protein
VLIEEVRVLVCSSTLCELLSMFLALVMGRSCVFADRRGLWWLDVSFVLDLLEVHGARNVLFPASTTLRETRGYGHSTVAPVMRSDVKDLAGGIKRAARAVMPVFGPLWSHPTPLFAMPPPCRRLPRRLQTSSLIETSCSQIHQYRIS